ncbi:hypothetical protein DFH28DRAFT_1037922, partial [Melampsora americana]
MILEATSDEQSESDIQRSREPPSDDAYLHVATEPSSASPSAITTLENDKSGSLDVIQEDTAVQPKGKEDNEDQPQSPLEISDLIRSDQPSSTGLVSPDYATESIPNIPITDAAVELDKPFENSTKGSNTTEASALNSISVAPSDNVISAASDDQKHLTPGAPSNTCEGHTPSIVNSEVASKDLTADPNQHEPDVSLELTSKSMIEESFDISSRAQHFQPDDTPDGISNPLKETSMEAMATDIQLESQTDTQVTSVTLATVNDGGSEFPASADMLSEQPQEEQPATELGSIQTALPPFLDANPPPASPTSATFEHVTRSPETSEVIEPDDPDVNTQVSPSSLSHEIQPERVMNQFVASGLQENHLNTTDSNARSVILPIGVAEAPELSVANTASSEQTQGDQPISELLSPPSLPAIEADSSEESRAPELPDRDIESGAEVDAQLASSVDLTEDDHHPGNDAIQLTPSIEPPPNSLSLSMTDEQVEQLGQLESSNTTFESDIEISNPSPTLQVSSETIELSTPNDSKLDAVVKADVSPTLDPAPKVLESQDGQAHVESMLESSNMMSESFFEMGNASPTLEAPSDTRVSSILEDSHSPVLAVEADALSTFDPEPKVLEPQDEHISLSDRAQVTLESSNVTSESVVEKGTSSTPLTPTSETRDPSPQEDSNPPISPVESAASPELDPDMKLESSNSSSDLEPEPKVLESLENTIQSLDQAEPTIVTSHAISKSNIEIRNQVPEDSSDTRALSPTDDSNSLAVAVESDVFESQDANMDLTKRVEATTESSEDVSKSETRDLSLSEDSTPSVAIKSAGLESQDATLQSSKKAEVTDESSHATSQTVVEISNPSPPPELSDTGDHLSAEDSASPNVAVAADVFPDHGPELEAPKSTDDVVQNQTDGTLESSNVISESVVDIGHHQPPPEISSEDLLPPDHVTSPTLSVESVESQAEVFQPSKEAEVGSPPEDLILPTEVVAADVVPEPEASKSADESGQLSNSTEATLESLNVDSDNVVDMVNSSSPLEATAEDIPPMADSSPPSVAVESALLKSQEEIQISQEAEVTVESSNFTPQNVVEVPPEVLSDDKDLPSPQDSSSATVAIKSDISCDLNPEPQTLETHDECIQLSSQAEGTLESPNDISKTFVDVANPLPEASSDTRELLPLQDLTSAIETVEITESTQMSKELVSEVIVESPPPPLELSSEVSPSDDSTLPTMVAETDVSPDLTPRAEEKSTEELVDLSTNTEELLSDTKELSPPEDSTLPTVPVEVISPAPHPEPESLESQDEATPTLTQNNDTLESPNKISKSVFDLENASASEALPETKDLSPPEEPASPTVVVETDSSPDLGTQLEVSKTTEENIELSIETEEVLSDTKDLSPLEDSSPPMAAVEAEVSPAVDPESEALEPQDEATQTSTPQEDTLQSSNDITKDIAELENASASEALPGSQNTSPPEDSASPTVVVETDSSPDLGTQLEVSKTNEENIELSTETEEVLSDTKDLSPPEDSSPPMAAVEAEISPAVDPESEALEPQDEATQTSTPQEDTLQSSNDITKDIAELENASASEALPGSQNTSPPEDSASPTVVVETDSSPDLGT